MSSKQKTLFETWKKPSHKVGENSKSGPRQENIQNEVYSPHASNIFQSPVFQRNAPDPEEFDPEAGQTWIYPTNYPVRDYQFSIVKEALFQNTLVVLPTGLGKTFIAAVVMFNIYRWYPKGKIVFMAPTRPLVAQQIEACFKVTGIPQEDTTQMTGTNVSDQRKLMWQKKRVFFLTPQVLANDLVRNICPAASIKCVVVDEAHKALGNHSYCQVIRELCSYTTNFRVLALTATPGSETQSVKQVLSNLLISRVEMRTEDSEDVKQYSHIRDTEKIVVPLGEELSSLKGKFLDIIHGYLKRLQRRNAMGPKNPSSLSKFQMLKLREAFSQQPPSTISRHEYGLIMADFSLCISLYHAFELLLLHGTRSFYNFLIGIVNGEKSIPHARSELSKNFCFEEVMQEIKEKYIGDSEGTSHDNGRMRRLLPSHPKLVKLQEIVLEHFRILEADNAENTRVMIFSQYRDSVQEITELLSRHEPLIKVMSFLGQAAKSGSSAAFTQKLQLQVIEKFRTGGYNTLVATCVGEEGLDIGEVDLIVCYDCPKSPVRLVQRMGRTGRFRKGRIIILLSEGKEEQTYKTCEYQKKSINQAIKKGFSGAQLYQNSPSLIPNGVRPVCVKKDVEIGEVKKCPPKKKQSKATAYLTEEEKREYDVSFRVPENDRPLLLSSEMVSLKPPEEVVQSGSSLHRQKDSQLSLSKWSLWQTTPQRTRFISHSRQTSILVEIIEQIETNSENIPKLDSSTLHLARKCEFDTYNGPDSNNAPLYDCDDMLFEDDSDVICLGSQRELWNEPEIPQKPSFSFISEKSNPKDNLLKRLFGIDFTKSLNKGPPLSLKPPPSKIGSGNFDDDPVVAVKATKSFDTILHILNKKITAKLKRKAKELGMNIPFGVPITKLRTSNDSALNERNNLSCSVNVLDSSVTIKSTINELSCLNASLDLSKASHRKVSDDKNSVTSFVLPITKLQANNNSVLNEKNNLSHSLNVLDSPLTIKSITNERSCLNDSLDFSKESNLKDMGKVSDDKKFMPSFKVPNLDCAERQNKSSSASVDNLEACEAISFDLDFDFQDDILESPKVIDHGKNTTSLACIPKTLQADSSLKVNNSKEVKKILKQFSTSKQSKSPNLDASFSQTLKVKKVVMENDVACNDSFNTEKNTDARADDLDTRKTLKINSMSGTNPCKVDLDSSFSTDSKKRTLNTSIGATQCTLTQLVDMINSTGCLKKSNQASEGKGPFESPKSKNAPSSSDDEVAPTPPKNSQRLQRITKSVPNFDGRHLLKRSASASECSSRYEKPQKSGNGRDFLSQFSSAFECREDEKISEKEQDELPAIEEIDMGATQKLEFDISFDFFASSPPAEADYVQENVCDNAKSEVLPQNIHKTELQCPNEPNVRSPETKDDAIIRPDVVQQVGKEELLGHAFSTKDSSARIPNKELFPEPDEGNFDNLCSQSILQSSTIGSPVKSYPERTAARKNIFDDSLFKVPESKGFPATSKVSGNSMVHATNNIKESVGGNHPKSKRRFMDSDDSDDDFQFIKKLKTTASKSDDGHNGRKQSSKSKKRKRNKFLLTQADVSGPESSEEDDNVDEDRLEDSFIDDDAFSQQNDTDQQALYLRSIRGFAGLPQKYKLKFPEPRNDDVATETIYDDTNYEFDSFCVGDNDVEYLSSDNDKTPERKKASTKRFKRIRTIDSSSSNDETSPRKSFKPNGGEKGCFNNDSATSNIILPTLRKSANDVGKSLESSVNKAKSLESTANKAKSLENPVNKAKSIESSVNKAKSIESSVNKAKILESSVNKAKSLENPVNKAKNLESSLNKAVGKSNHRENPSSKLARKVISNKTAAAVCNNAASINAYPDYGRKNTLGATTSGFRNLAQENDIEIVYESADNKYSDQKFSRFLSSLQNKNVVRNSVKSNQNHPVPPEFVDDVMCFDLENLDETFSEFEGAKSLAAEKNKPEISKGKINANEGRSQKDIDEVMCFDLENLDNLSEFEDIEQFAIEKKKQGKKEASKNNIDIKSSVKKAVCKDVLREDADEVMCFDLENFDDNLSELEDIEHFDVVKNKRGKTEVPKERNEFKSTEKKISCGNAVHEDADEAVCFDLENFDENILEFKNSENFCTERNKEFKGEVPKTTEDNKRNTDSALEHLPDVSFNTVWDEPASFCFDFDEIADNAAASTSTENNLENVPILVDSRELASGKPVISLLRNRYGIDPIVMHLTSADYVISSRLAVERVLDSEFSNHPMPPKIVEKIKTMQEMYEKITVVIEKDNRKQRLSFSKNDTKYLNFLLNVCWHKNTSILCSISPEHTAQLLFQLLQKEKKRNLHIGVPTTINSRNRDLYDFYSSFPLVSPVCALNFMYNFPVLKIFFESSAQEIKKAGLISSKRALQIFNYLRSEYFHIDS